MGLSAAAAQLIGAGIQGATTIGGGVAQNRADRDLFNKNKSLMEKTKAFQDEQYERDMAMNKRQMAHGMEMDEKRLGLAQQDTAKFAKDSKRKMGETMMDMMGQQGPTALGRSAKNLSRRMM